MGQSAGHDHVEGVLGWVAIRVEALPPGPVRRAGLRAVTEDGTLGDIITAASMAPLMTYCIEQFGPNRCMFESNFPPDKGQCSYQVIFNAFKRIAAQYSEAEKTALFSTGAEAIENAKAQNQKLSWSAALDIGAKKLSERVSHGVGAILVVVARDATRVAAAAGRTAHRRRVRRLRRVRPTTSSTR